MPGDGVVIMKKKKERKLIKDMILKLMYTLYYRHAQCEGVSGEKKRDNRRRTYYTVVIYTCVEKYNIKRETLMRSQRQRH